MKLDQVAEGTLGVNKSGNGLEAIAWWKNREFEKLRNYCLGDVRITRDLYDFAVKNNKLIFKEGGRNNEIKLDTALWETLPSGSSVMNRTLPFVVLGIIIVIIGVVAWSFSSRTPAPAEDITPAPSSSATNTPAQSNNNSTSTATSTPVSAMTVRYTEAGFSPATLTVASGTVVTFINQGGPEMWVGGDEHPSHTNYDGTSREAHCVGSTPSVTSFDQCGVGGTYSFMFSKAGTWEYHNHRRSSHRGTIVVE